MASPADTGLQAPPDTQSDYGSDFSPEEEEIVNSLLSLSHPSFGVVEDNPIINDVEYNDPPSTLRVPRVLGRERQLEETNQAMDGADTGPSLKPLDPGYPDLANAIDSPLPTDLMEVIIEGEVVDEAKDEQPDLRSPLERFRSPPKKPLSVTDLVSPAWCELQYWYMLKIHGRKKATKAMKGGTIVHQKLEEQIYTTVKVDVKTKEDVWGLKIWNVIQGLRTLEDIGHTRELQVWGTIDGQLVNGIIDEISFICPDTELEAELERKEQNSKHEPPPDQMTISDFFKASSGKSIAEATRSKRRAKSTKAYLCDVKTRSISLLPKGAAFRPTQMQLMLYHHLLSNLATNQVDLSVLLNHFNLNGDAPFSDEFIAQIGSLNDDVVLSSPNDASEMETQPSSQDSMSVLLAHNSLSSLWALMITQFQRVLPDGKASIGNVLKAEYRSRDLGEVVGVTTFPMDEPVLEAYLNRELQWWKGEREPALVAVEEAYKCKSCEYADICEWRVARVEEATQKSRRRKKEVKEKGEMKKSEI